MVTDGLCLLLANNNCELSVNKLRLRLERKKASTSYNPSRDFKYLYFYITLPI